MTFFLTKCICMKVSVKSFNNLENEHWAVLIRSCSCSLTVPMLYSPTTFIYDLKILPLLPTEPKDSNYTRIVGEINWMRWGGKPKRIPGALQNLNITRNKLLAQLSQEWSRVVPCAFESIIGLNYPNRWRGTPSNEGMFSSPPPTIINTAPPNLCRFLKLMHIIY